MLKVAKFGGSSLAEASQLKKVKDIIHGDHERRYVIVSAPGKRDKNDSKITDLLYLSHAHLKYGVSYETVFCMIEDRYREIKKTCGLKTDIEKEFLEIRSNMTKDISVDYLASRGEYLSALLVAEYLGYDFIDAKDWLFFSYDGEIDFEKSRQTLNALLSKSPKAVIPGFYGSLPNGAVKTLTRGGSDITGALVAAFMDADVYENWTDVSGILMTDPRIVENPKPIAKITYNELRELSYMGAEVLHEDAIFPVKEKNIPLNIRNTNIPDAPGTMIVETVEDSDADSGHFITGIAGRKNFTIVAVYKKQATSEYGAVRNAVKAFEKYKVKVEHIISGIDSFAVVVPADDVKNCLYDVIFEIKEVCQPESVKVTENIALIATVGRKMMYRPGVAGNLFGALGSNDVNIRMISQGTDEINIIVGVENKDFEKAVRVLYNSFMK